MHVNCERYPNFLYTLRTKKTDHTVDTTDLLFTLNFVKILHRHWRFGDVNCDFSALITSRPRIASALTYHLEIAKFQII
jgi:hypothetical protein